MVCNFGGLLGMWLRVSSLDMFHQLFHSTKRFILFINNKYIYFITNVNNFNNNFSLDIIVQNNNDANNIPPNLLV